MKIITLGFHWWCCSPKLGTGQIVRQPEVDETKRSLYAKVVERQAPMLLPLSVLNARDGIVSDCLRLDKEDNFGYLPGSVSERRGSSVRIASHVARCRL